MTKALARVPEAVIPAVPGPPPVAGTARRPDRMEASMTATTLVTGVGDALGRLLRPDLNELLLTLDGLDLTVDDLLAIARAADVPDEPTEWPLAG